MSLGLYGKLQMEDNKETIFPVHQKYSLLDNDVCESYKCMDVALHENVNNV